MNEFERGDRIKFNIDGITGTVIGEATSNRKHLGDDSWDYERKGLVVQLDHPVWQDTPALHISVIVVAPENAEKI